MVATLALTRPRGAKRRVRPCGLSQYVVCPVADNSLPWSLDGGLAGFVQTWIAVAGAILGTLVGSTTTYVFQRVAFHKEQQVRLRDLRRAAFLAFLTATHGHYESVLAARSVLNYDRAAGLAALESVSIVEGQSALDELRLIASGEPVTLAEKLWRQLRDPGFVHGRDGNAAAWKVDYWDARKEMISSAREYITKGLD